MQNKNRLKHMMIDKMRSDLGRLKAADKQQQNEIALQKCRVARLEEQLAVAEGAKVRYEAVTGVLQGGLLDQWDTLFWDDELYKQLELWVEGGRDAAALRIFNKKMTERKTRNREKAKRARKRRERVKAMEKMLRKEKALAVKAAVAGQGWPCIVPEHGKSPTRRRSACRQPSALSALSVGTGKPSAVLPEFVMCEITLRNSGGSQLPESGRFTYFLVTYLLTYFKLVSK